MSSPPTDLITTGLTNEQIWAAARAELDGLPDGQGLNIAHEAVDRHLSHGRADFVAVRYLPAAVVNGTSPTRSWPTTPLALPRYWTVSSAAAPESPPSSAAFPSSSSPRSAP